jgi:hypothetical protein
MINGNAMKSKNLLVGFALLFLALAALVSVLIWSDISFPVKIAMYALGFCEGVAVGALLGRYKEVSQ